MDKLLKALKDHLGSQQQSPKPEGKKLSNKSKPQKTEAKIVRKSKDLKGKNLETEPKPIPTEKFFATPKVNTPTSKRFSVASRATPLGSGMKRLSQITPRGLKARSSKQGTPASIQKPTKRQRTLSSDKQGSAKRRRKSVDENEKIETTDLKENINKKSPGTKRQSSSRLSRQNIANSTEKEKAIRRRTFDKEEASPNVKEIIGSLKGNMTVNEMKECILSSLNKKVKIAEKPEDDKPVSQIPRFAAYLAARKKQMEENKKPVTPGNKDWSKVHKKQFSKMDSIGTYLEKKKQRQEAMTNSTKKMKLITEQTRSAIQSLKQLHTPPTSAVKPFVPQVTSLAKINTNFTSMKSPRTATKKATVGTPSSSTKENKGVPKSAVTPFKGGALNTSNLNSSHNVTLDSTTMSASKKSFDLAASLAKPLSWKPHTGKLKPFGMGGLYQVREVRENKGNVKDVKVTSRETRRRMANAKRADHRSAAQLKRRGINA